MHIAIVEDSPEQQKLLYEYVQKYAAETGTQHTADLFSDGESLLENYQPQYDIILLDIELPGINGMEVAHEIRLRDDNVVMMFITNMAHYAVEGYSVGALDFV